MADKKKGGRYTPPKASVADADKPSSTAGSSSVRRPRRPLLDERARAEMAKRPQSLRYQFTMSGIWIALGVAMFVLIPATWKVVPAMFFVAIGLFSMRGAVRTALHGDARAPGTRAADETAAKAKPKVDKASKPEAPKIAAPRARRRSGADTEDR